MIVSNRDIAAQVRLVSCHTPNVLHSSKASHWADHPPKACSIASAGVVHPERCLAELLAARTVARVHGMGCHYMERTARATIWPVQKTRRKTVQYVVSTRRKGMDVRPSLAPRTGLFTGWYQEQGVAFGCACVCGLHQPHPPSTAAPRHGLTYRNLKHMCCKVTVMAALSLQSAVLSGTTFHCCTSQAAALLCKERLWKSGKAPALGPSIHAHHCQKPRVPNFSQVDRNISKGSDLNP